MKNKSYLILINILTVIYSCNNPTSELQVEYTIRVNPSKVDIEKHINIKSYTLLETTSQNLISDVKKGLIFNDKIYLSDFSNKSVFVFNDNGSFLRKLDEEGRGPGEYNALDDFSIDEDNNLLVILSGQQNKLFFYDINSLDYIKAIDFQDGLFPFSLECITNNSFALGRNHVCYSKKLA